MERRPVPAMRTIVALALSVGLVTSDARAMHEVPNAPGLPILPCDPTGPIYQNGHHPVRCSAANVDDCNCAEVLPQACSGPSAIGDKKSFLWLVTDDQAYCMYRFMRERVAGDPYDPAGDAVRIDDLGCRYRNAGPPDGLVDHALVFGRDREDPVTLGACNVGSGYCERSYCTVGSTFVDFVECSESGTPPPGVTCQCGRKQCSTDADCVMLTTPALDSLAAQGAVFPVAHVPENVCETSWKGLHTGRYWRDIVGCAAEADGELRSCECRIPEQSQPALDCPALLVPGTCQVGKPCQNNPSFVDDRNGDQCADCPDGCSPHGCGELRTLSRLLHEDPQDPYYTHMIGKLRVGSGGYVGWGSCPSYKYESDEGIGVLRDSDCPAGSSCDVAVQGCVPPGCAPEDVPIPQVARDRLEKLTDWLQQELPTDSNYQLLHPFFITWAPVTPHEGGPPGDPAFARRHYFYCDPNTSVNGTNCAANQAVCWSNKTCQKPLAGRHADTALRFAKLTALDFMVNAMRDELKRHCVCVGDTAKSLWDLTVFVTHSDHGALMPRGKSYLPDANQMRGENGYRTTLLISHPGHRDGTLVPDVFTEHLIDTADVFRTMLGHMDGDVANDEVPGDLKGKDLMHILASGGTFQGATPCAQSSQCTDPSRPTCMQGGCRRACSYHGECASGEICTSKGWCSRPIHDVLVTQGEEQGWMTRVAAGKVGICAAGSTPKFCVVDGECSTGPCRTGADAASAEGSRMCMNWPAQNIFHCTADERCGLTLCANQSDCETTGVCQGAEPGAGFVDHQGNVCQLRADFTMNPGLDICVPKGVCAPPALKIGFAKDVATQEPSYSSIFVYDLHANPDENDGAGGQPILTAANLGCCLRCLVTECTRRWSRWDPPTNVSDDPTGCFTPTNPACQASCDGTFQCVPPT